MKGFTITLAQRVVWEMLSVPIANPGFAVSGIVGPCFRRRRPRGRKYQSREPRGGRVYGRLGLLIGHLDCMVRLAGRRRRISSGTDGSGRMEILLPSKQVRVRVGLGPGPSL